MSTQKTNKHQNYWNASGIVRACHNCHYLNTQMSNTSSFKPGLIRPSASNHTPKWKWSPEEDAILVEAIEKNGVGNWGKLAQLLPGRNGKQCRERWTGKLCPNLTQQTWTAEEDIALLHLQRMHGNLWSKIATFMAGRSAIGIKNRWCYLVRRNIPQQFETTLKAPSCQSSPEIISSPPVLPLYESAQMVMVQEFPEPQFPVSDTICIFDEPMDYTAFDFANELGFDLL